MNGNSTYGFGFCTEYSEFRKTSNLWSQKVVTKVAIFCFDVRIDVMQIIKVYGKK